MRREEPAETGSPTLNKSLSALEDELESEAFAAIGKDWKKLSFRPWESNPFPQRKTKPQKNA